MRQKLTMCVVEFLGHFHVRVRECARTGTFLLLIKLYGFILCSNNGDELLVLIMSGNINSNDVSAYVYSVRSSNECADATHFV